MCFLSSFLQKAILDEEHSLSEVLLKLKGHKFAINLHKNAFKMSLLTCGDRKRQKKEEEEEKRMNHAGEEGEVIFVDM